MADRARRLLAWVLALWTSLCLAACVEAAAIREKSTVYKWLPTESAPERYPMRLLNGSFTLPDGSQVAVPGRRDVANGWGERGSTHIVGEAAKPLPQRLDLEWFSYTENRFYKGSFALPVPAMSALFQSGVPKDRQTGQRADFERLIVGMAPGGLAVLWLAAGAEVVEVGAWRAEAADLPWTRVLDNPDVPREVFIRKVLSARLGPDGLERLQREGVPTTRYADYRSTYRWRPWVTGAGKALQVRVRSFNGENAYIAADGPVLPREMRPVPAELELQWSVPGGAPLWARVRFDEAEIFAAYAKLSRGDAQRQLALQLDTTATAVAVTLRDEKFVLPLEKARVEILRDR